jgi:hypothetical protein
MEKEQEAMTNDDFSFENGQRMARPFIADFLENDLFEAMGELQTTYEEDKLLNRVGAFLMCLGYHRDDLLAWAREGQS